MRFDEMLARRANAAQVPAHVEYPKYVDVSGIPVLVQDADEEATVLRRIADPSDDTEAGDDVANFLSSPEKRKPGRPRKVEAPDSSAE